VLLKATNGSVCFPTALRLVLLLDQVSLNTAMTTSPVDIPIVLEDGINHAFMRANFSLLSKYSEMFPDTLTFKEKMPILKNLWEKEFKVKIIFSDGAEFNWKKIQFASDSDRTLFLLTWGSE